MNAGTQTARSAPLSFVAANEDQTKHAGFPVDFQDLCALAMDQALGIEKASLSTVIISNSCVIDIYKNAFWFAPIVGNLLDMAAQSVTCSVELQMTWLTFMAPSASSTVAGTSGGQAQPISDDPAHSMDIAIGARAA